MDEVYRLFDRRCRTDTALAKLTKLRNRVRRFKQVGKTLGKLFSPNLDKALTFLDDKLLPSTSNAVERGYRRHREMQKSIYRVRTMTRRIALDMLRDLQSLARSLTTNIDPPKKSFFTNHKFSKQLLVDGESRTTGDTSGFDKFLFPGEHWPVSVQTKSKTSVEDVDEWTHEWSKGQSRTALRFTTTDYGRGKGEYSSEDEDDSAK